MEKVNKNNEYAKNAILGLIGILLYFVLYEIKGLPFGILGIDTSKIPEVVKVIYLIIYEIFMMSLFALIFNKELVKQAKDMKKNHKTYYKKYFKYYLIGFMVMMLSNAIIIFLFNKGMADNEELIRKNFEISPLYIYFSGVLFAPFVEELVFRGCVRKIITNKYLFVILSGLIFGYIHISDYVTTSSDFLYLIPYGSLGLAFAYVYCKTDNIFTNMGLHFMHNGILLSLEFLVLLYG